MQSKKIIFLLFIPILIIVSGSQKYESEKPILIKDTEILLKILSSDKVEGRATNTQGFDKASKFVESYMLNNHILPFYGKSYRDTLKYSDYAGYNLVAKVGNFEFGRKTVVIGAHLDHLGIHGKKIYNGANDNATGCVALMQVAGYLNQFEHDENIIIAFFAGEEDGKLGSKDLARKLRALGFPPEYMINFEMLGIPLTKGETNQAYISGYELSNLADLLNKYAEYEFITKFKHENFNDVFYRSDNYSFYEEFDIPAHTIISFDFKNDPNYHKVSDDFENIDLEHLNGIINQSAFSINKLLQDNQVPVFKKDKKKTYSKKKLRP